MRERKREKEERESEKGRKLKGRGNERCGEIDSQGRVSSEE